MSVCPSVTRRGIVSKRLELFSPIGWSTILVYPCQNYGNVRTIPLNGVVKCRWGWKIKIFDKYIASSRKWYRTRFSPRRPGALGEVRLSPTRSCRPLADWRSSALALATVNGRIVVLRYTDHRGVPRVSSLVNNSLCEIYANGGGLLAALITRHTCLWTTDVSRCISRLSRRTPLSKPLRYEAIMLMPTQALTSINTQWDSIH